MSAFAHQIRVLEDRVMELVYEFEEANPELFVSNIALELDQNGAINGLRIEVAACREQEMAP